MEAGRLDDIFEHMAHVAVDILDIELAFLHALDDFFDLGGLTGLHEVVASMYLAGSGKTFADANPVGYHDTLVPPIVAQDLGEQVVVAHGEFAIDLVI